MGMRGAGVGRVGVEVQEEEEAMEGMVEGVEDVVGRPGGDGEDGDGWLVLVLLCLVSQHLAL
tara:strand:- start:8090 stop:8275 length:186 start_codon:yes stop_codon:yes gene_type:complete